MASRYYQILNDMGGVVQNYAEQIGFDIETPVDPFCWVLTDPDGLQDNIQILHQRENVDLYDGPNRIVVWQSDGVILPPDMVGGGLLDIGGPVRGEIRRVRSVNIWSEIWFNNEETTEENLHQWIIAWDTATHNAIVFNQEVWEDQQADQYGNLKDGRLVRFSCTVQIPVYRAYKPLTTPSDLQVECEFESE